MFIILSLFDVKFTKLWVVVTAMAPHEASASWSDEAVHLWRSRAPHDEPPWAVFEAGARSEAKRHSSMMIQPSRLIARQQCARGDSVKRSLGPCARERQVGPGGDVCNDGSVELAKSDDVLFAECEMGLCRVMPPGE